MTETRGHQFNMRAMHLRSVGFLIAVTILAGCTSQLTQYREWHGIVSDKSVKNGTDIVATNNFAGVPARTTEQSKRIASSLNELRWQSYYNLTRWDPDVNPSSKANSLLSVLEFDDQGEMWDRNQLLGTLAAIENYKRQGHPVTLVVFVHGWKHDASDYSLNLTQFRSFVTNFATYFSEQEGTNTARGSERVVVGVYLAWRGNTYEHNSSVMRAIMWPFKQLSFYSRKSAATRVADVACTEAILSLSATVRMDVQTDTSLQNQANTKARDDSKVIIIGHSMGGLIVERAVSQAMLGGMLINASKVADADKVRQQLLAKSAELKKDATNHLNGIKPLEIILGNRNWDEFAFDRTNQLTAALIQQRVHFQANEHQLSRLRAQLDSRTQELTTILHAAWREWNALVDLPWFGYGEVEKLGVEAGFDHAFVKSNVVVVTESTEQAVRLDAAAQRLALQAGLTRLDEIIGSFNSVTNVVNREEFFRIVRLVEKSTNRIANLLTNDAFSAYAGAVNELNAANDELRTTASSLNAVVNDLNATNRFIENEWKSLRNNIMELKAEADQLFYSASEWERKAEEFPHRSDIGKPPADLILLANPASEALTARMLSQALQAPLIQNYTTLTNNNRPWIVSVSSDGDRATSWMFPRGRWISAQFHDFRKYEDGAYSQKGYYMHTAPHFAPMLSHLVKMVRTNGIGTNVFDILKANLNTNLNGNQEFWVYSPKGIYEVESNTNRDVENDSVYWVMKAEKVLIPSHGAIFTPEFLSIAAALYRISQRQVATHGPPTGGEAKLPSSALVTKNELR